MLTSFGLTDIGRRRDHNEDAIFLSDTLGLYLVADGLGGHASGEVASAMAIEIISECVKQANGVSIAEIIQRANTDIFQSGRNRVGVQAYAGGDKTVRMGTTIVGLYIQKGKAIIAHVGDSRAYRIRTARLEPLTVDHSLGAMAAKQGAPPIQSKFKNVLARAVGIEPKVIVDIRKEELLPDDLFLLCSDGLTNMVRDEQIETSLASGLPLQQLCKNLVDKANQNGGVDNISCVLVRYNG